MEIQKKFETFRFLRENKSVDAGADTTAYTTIPPGVDPFKMSGKVKFGIDPTADRMHLGHLVPLKVVKRLKENGSDVHIILGTFTAQMGDPSGKDTTRPILSAADTMTNAESLLKIVKRVLGDDITVHKNNEWFDKYTLPEIMNILSKFTVSHLLSRDAFQKRLSSSSPIGMHELIVPILQGLDSYELEAEIEVGGSDQMFNFYLSRETQEMMDQTPEKCIMTPIINGTDGRKMSKSFNNCIWLDDSPKDVFGKAMSISDDVMFEWYPLFVDNYDRNDHPMKLKKDLAQQITSEVWGEAEGLREREDFESQFQKKKLPEDMKEVTSNNIVDFIVELKGVSKSDARRLIQANAVNVMSEEGESVAKVTDFDYVVPQGTIIKVGKRDWARSV
jgi:tyrosyl-tRNA synthetase